MGVDLSKDPLNRQRTHPVVRMAGAGLPNGGGTVFVIACAGVVCWLLLITVTLCLCAAAKRGDELENGANRYLSDSGGDAKVIPLFFGKRCV